MDWFFQKIGKTRALIKFHLQTSNNILSHKFTAMKKPKKKNNRILIDKKKIDFAHFHSYLLYDFVYKEKLIKIHALHELNFGTK